MLQNERQQAQIEKVSKGEAIEGAKQSASEEALRHQVKQVQMNQEYQALQF